MKSVTKFIGDQIQTICDKLQKCKCARGAFWKRTNSRRKIRLVNYLKLKSDQFFYKKNRDSFASKSATYVVWITTETDSSDFFKKSFRNKWFHNHHSWNDNFQNLNIWQKIYEFCAWSLKEFSIIITIHTFHFYDIVETVWQYQFANKSPGVWIQYCPSCSCFVGTALAKQKETFQRQHNAQVWNSFLKEYSYFCLLI